MYEGEPGLVSLSGYSYVLSACYRQKACCTVRFLFPIFKICAIATLISPKAARAARSEAGMDCGTALAEQARLNRYGEALRGASSLVHARRRPPPRGETEGSARKPLNSLESRKEEAWISLPVALIFLPKDLDFPSRGFENLSSKTAPLPLTFIDLRTAGEAPLLREAGARLFRMCECGRASGRGRGKVQDAA